MRACATSRSTRITWLQTGAPHPMAAEIIAAGPTDWRDVVRRADRGRCRRSGDAGRAIFYQKQMTHHLLPDVGREWLELVTNCFLIRSPDEVLRSYLKKNYEPTALDLGFPQQAEIYDYVKQRTGRTPIVLDARDVLRKAARNARPAVRRARRADARRDALLADRLPPDRRHLGPALVWRSREDDGVRQAARRTGERRYGPQQSSSTCFASATPSTLACGKCDCAELKRPTTCNKSSTKPIAT